MGCGKALGIDWNSFTNRFLMICLMQLLSVRLMDQRRGIAVRDLDLATETTKITAVITEVVIATEVGDSINTGIANILRSILMNDFAKAVSLIFKLLDTKQIRR
jgi:hypothetical protein